MSKRNPKSVEETLEVVHLYLEQEKSIAALVNVFGVSVATIRYWIRKYHRDDIEGLKESPSWKKYRSELKEQTINDYLTCRGSLSMIVKKYSISSHSVLKKLDKP